MLSNLRNYLIAKSIVKNKFMEINKIIEKAELNLERQIEWIGKHDIKTSFVAGVAIAMLGVAANLDYSILRCTSYTIVITLTFLLLALSLFYVYLSQFPKVNSPNHSLLFFGTIADRKLNKFQEEFKSINEEKYLEDLLHQTHVNADIVKKKFNYLKLALIFLLLAVIPWSFMIYKTKNQTDGGQKIERFYKFHNPSQDQINAIYR